VRLCPSLALPDQLIADPPGPFAMATLKAIKEKAVLDVRETISQQFVDPSKLDELPLLISELEKKLQTAESKLNSAVQSKLDSLKRSVDLMDESSSKLSKLSATMNRVDRKIAETNSSIANFRCLSKVHNARENIDKTIKQVEFFAEVPRRVNFLRNLLDEDPANLKEVCSTLIHYIHNIHYIHYIHFIHYIYFIHSYRCIWRA
jgi:chromosome segregation ATPase